MRRAPSLYAEPRMPAWWDRIIIVLTLVAIVLLLLDMTITGESELAPLLVWLDLGLCAMFVLDFTLRAHKAVDRWHFFKRNWFDLLGAIPLVEPLRMARAVRFVRILRLLRIAALVRRHLVRHDIRLPRSLAHVGLAALLVWVLAGTVFYAIERGKNENIEFYEDALWWSITTLSTVGYGDLYPVTYAGRLVALITMVLGVGVLGSLAASLASAFIEAQERAKKGMRSYSMSDHLLILGWNDSANVLVEEFSQDPRYSETPIVIVADLERAPFEGRQVRFVRGSHAHRSVLDRAAAASAAAALVVPSGPESGSDLQTAVTIAALRRMNSSVRISAQLVDAANRELLIDAGCDAVVSPSMLTATLLVRSLQDKGTLELVEDLLSNAGGSQLYRARVPERWVGRPFRDYAASLLDQRVSAIALARRTAIIPNPDPQLLLEQDDDVFVVSETPPGELGGT